MDVKKFSEESFDAIDWINQSFASANEAAKEGNKESHAANLVFQLQLFIQEINSSLEQTAHQVINNLPLVLRQTESLEDEVASLRQQLDDMQSQLKSSGNEKRTREDIDKIQKLLLLVDRMKACTVKAASNEVSPIHHPDLRTFLQEGDTASEPVTDTDT